MERLSYEDVCRIVGDLYLNSRKQLEIAESGKTSALELQKLRQELASTQAELERIKFLGTQDP